MKILVTGANGFIGRNICEHLSGKHDLLGPSHKELELLDEAAVRAYINQNGVDVIIHCANKGGTRNTAGAERVVEDNLRIFFNLARNSNLVDKMIYFGSGAEYGKHRDLKKIKEEQFDEVVPKDDYGFYKYACSRYAEKSENIYNLRLFGVFGKYENYEMRFISNAIVKNLLGIDITINQNVVFDYLYIPDLIRVVEHFLKNKPKFHAYNVTPDKSIDLLEICEMVNKISKKKSKTKVLNLGLNNEYTGSNSRLKREFPGTVFTNHEDAIRDLFSFYSSALPTIKKEDIVSDRYLACCKSKT